MSVGINDPCAPGFDPQTGIYHLFYQWNPNSHAWGDISWGHATSQDMIYWQHLDQEVRRQFLMHLRLLIYQPALSPDQTYDCCGVFTGCLFPSGPFGAKDEISVFYSSVNHLPISWREPYTRGCEGLAMATSNDGGKTCELGVHLTSLLVDLTASKGKSTPRIRFYRKNRPICTSLVLEILSSLHGQPWMLSAKPLTSSMV